QDLAKTTRADPANINLGIKYKSISFRTMYDQFETSDPVTFVSNKNFYADLRYNWKVNDKLLLIPQVKYYNQIPWTYGSVDSGEKDFNVRATRTLAQLDAMYDVSRKIQVTLGGVYFRDEGTDLLAGDLFAGNKKLALNNFAFFAQGLFKHRLANATVGFRYEKNNRYGAAFVPRIALTKKIQNLHFKLLYSQAFRAPSIQNINIALNGEIEPEKSNVFEVELGYQFTPEMLLSVNAFSITTKDVLIYSSEGEGDTFTEWYENYTKSGSNGIEVVYSLRKKLWYANLTYSFSKAINDNTVTTYDVPGQTQYVGFSKSKVTLNTNFSFTPRLSFNPSFIYAGKRYAYTSTDDDDNPVLGELNPYLLINAFLNYRGVLESGFNIGVGAYDLANERPGIPQAYNGGYAPIPGRSREYVVKISYEINFKK
ncbi:MAG: hypothetical protein C0490_17660, partial [Marivirga sp.]|nr:hypothetical protein [Marivirga sp.]